MTWIEKQIPLSVGKHRITSAVNGDYNCIAWATGDDSSWWSHLPGYKWPVLRGSDIDSLVAVFVHLGFKKSKPDDVSLEPDCQKVVLYAKDEKWSHAARQLATGKWTSKLGPDEDIEHDTPECLCGESYGIIHCVMRKNEK